MTSILSAQPSRTWLLTAFAVIYVGWGSTFLAVRYAVATMPPFIMAGTRNLVAGAVLMAIARASGAGWPTARQWLRAAVVGGLMFVLNHGGIGWASQRTPSGVVALIVATIPLWIVVLEWGLGSARPSRRASVGLLVGFAGTVALVAPGRLTGGVDPLAGLVVSVAAVGWAIGTVVSRRYRVSELVLVATGLPMLAGGAALFVVATLAGEWHAFEIAAVDLRAWLSLAYLVGVGSLLGFSAYMWLLRSVPAARVATYAYVNPIVALTLGALLAGEPLSLPTLLAGALSLFGVFLVVSR